MEKVYLSLIRKPISYFFFAYREEMQKYAQKSGTLTSMFTDIHHEPVQLSLFYFVMKNLFFIRTTSKFYFSLEFWFH